ncbi:MAG: hypothetical protein MJZ08_08510 [Bacteroidaceae bacterium]|nr:hypothetical protein [Bacteroidaceae bacterium]
METESKKRTSIFLKMLDDKKAIRECLRNNGNLGKLAKERGIQFATPV